MTVRSLPCREVFGLSAKLTLFVYCLPVPLDTPLQIEGNSADSPPNKTTERAPSRTANFHATRVL